MKTLVFMKNKYGNLQLVGSKMNYPTFTSLLQDYPGRPVTITKYKLRDGDHPLDVLECVIK